MKIPDSFFPFQNMPYPCLLLADNGTLYSNDAAKKAGPPFADEAAMAKILRTTAQELSHRGSGATTRPFLTDALNMRTMTVMQTGDGLLAIATEEKESPVYAFSSQMRERLTDIFATLPILSAHADEEDLRYTEEIQANCYQLLRLASNLESAGMVEQKRFDIQPVDLTALLESLRQSLDTVGRGLSVPLEWSLPKEELPVKANPRLLSQAILNLIRNSMAYTRDGNRITITLEKAAGRALLTVEDRGLGIKPEFVDRIFEPYFSIDPYGDNHLRPGVGLGLAVVRETVCGFGGTVNVESRFGEGTKIFCALPLSTDAEELLQGDGAEYLINRYSPVYVQLCGYVRLPLL